jgi:hypothetical protein
MVKPYMTQFASAKGASWQAQLSHDEGVIDGPDARSTIYA